MVDQPSSLEDLSSCFICTAEFEENGDHIPRLLPCTHTLCEKCIKEIIHRGILKCPFCKKLHPAWENEKSFTQNKYILNQVKRKLQEGKHKCEEHGKELSLFCKKPGCQKPICISCLRRYHRKHDFVEIGKETEALMKDIEIVQTNLIEKKKVLLNTLEEVEEKTEKCVTTLKKKSIEIRREIDKHCKKIIQEAKNVRDEESNQVQCAVDDMNENLTILESIRQDGGPHVNIYDLAETLKNISDYDPYGGRTFHFPQYKSSLVTSRMNYDLGSIQKQEITVRFPELSKDLATESDTESESESELELESEAESESEFELEAESESEFEFEPEAKLALSHKNRPIPKSEPEKDYDPAYRYKYLHTHNSVRKPALRHRYTLGTLPEPNAKRSMTQIGQLIFTGPVRSTIDTGLNRVSCLALLNNGSVSVFGKEVSKRRLKCYNAHTGDTLRIFHLDVDCYGMVEIMFAGKPTLAVAYEDKTGFRTQSKIHFVDCGESEPKSIPDRTLALVDRTINDMTYTIIHGKQLLITTNRQRGVKCYNLQRKSLEWSFRGSLDGMKKDLDATGVTTDGRGHLLVCDFVGNHCIQMFSVLDGQYLRCVARDIWKELGQPGMIRWHETSSPFVVVTTKKRNKWYISKIYVKYQTISFRDSVMGMQLSDNVHIINE